jgi:hypothetical protein
LRARRSGDPAADQEVVDVAHRAQSTGPPWIAFLFTSNGVKIGEMVVVPIAHLGHALPLLPFFGPPLLIASGLVVMAARDRLRNKHGRGPGSPPPDPR